jgi:hypothetical protein
LESRLLAIAAEANRAELDNSTGSALPGLSEADKADVESFLTDMLLIYPVLGVTAFDRHGHAGPKASQNERLYLTMKGTKAEGSEVADGFLVYKDSLARQMLSLPFTSMVLSCGSPCSPKASSFATGTISA